MAATGALGQFLDSGWDIGDLAGLVLPLHQIVDLAEVGGESVHPIELLKGAADVVAAGDGDHGFESFVACSP
jgi:hypothetical protein